ncbi:MAG: flagellar hook-length control protein FliK [Nitrosospira sp.]|nr:flagellar hook-length control protein FliK [Nitrosospira sp.]
MTPGTVLNNAPEHGDVVVDDLKGLKNLKDIPADRENLKEITDWKNLKDLQAGVAIHGRPEARETKETKETKADATAIATLPGQADHPKVLHDLIAAHSSDSRPGAGAGAATTTETTEIPADVRNGASIDVRAEPITTAAQYAGLTLLQPGLAAARHGKAGTGADASAALQPAAAGDPRLQTPGVAAAMATTPASVKRAIEARDMHQGLRKEAEIKVASGAGRGGSQQTQFRLPELSLSTETGTFGTSLSELASQGLYHEGLHVEGFSAKDLPAAGLPNISATPAVIGAEQGVAPTTPGTGAQSASWLEPRVGAAGWDNALGQKVLWMVSSQQQVAELNLNPPDLGPLQVVLSLSNDQASATFVSQHADVRQALEAALPRLKEMMAESGISLAETTVSADTSQRQGGYEGFERQDRPATHHGGNRETVAAPNAKTHDIGMSRIPAGGNRLVDTFA